MLSALSVRNFALVENLDVAFLPRLTAITGESGAGKSILVAALSIVLGARGERRLVRPGTASLDVTAEFEVSSDSAASRFLLENDLLDQEIATRVVVRRVVRADGGSRAWVNATPVAVAALKELCSPMVEIHGQFEHQRLLDRNVQLEWLDDFAGNADLRIRVAAAYKAWRKTISELGELRERMAASQEQRELLKYKSELLNALALGPKELENLSAKHKRLAQAGILQERITQARIVVEGPHSDAIAQASRSLEEIDDIHPSLMQARDLLATATISIDEARKELRSYDEAIELDEVELKRIEQRLDQIYETSRRLRVQPHQLADLASELNQEIDGLANESDRERALTDQAAFQESEFRELAEDLSRKRRQGCVKFEKDICETMARIGLPNAKLIVAFTLEVTGSGLERAEYLVSTNPSYVPIPLSQVASGGELARISLAIQVVAAKSSQLPCLILDEADIGVSGTSADVIGRLLHELAETTQVICVTHAAQVAAIADHHLRVAKTREQDVRIAAISHQDRIEEIARMVSGRAITPDAREYAKTLLNDGSGA